MSIRKHLSTRQVFSCYIESMQLLVGIDEAGRGPLAGPVSVGAVSVGALFDVAREFPGVADSKSISENKREKIFELLEARDLAGDVRFSVSLVDAQFIDEHGITSAIRKALAQALSHVAPDPAFVQVLLDGSLSAPSEYLHQETIIHGDSIKPVISLASIAAKVTRDRLMCHFATEYPLYGFERHKGYGTALHRDAIAKHGQCPLHRNTFIHIKERTNR